MWFSLGCPLRWSEQESSLSAKTAFHNLDQSEPITCSDWRQTSPNGGQIRFLFLKSKNYRYFSKRTIFDEGYRRVW
jgi:hypothetical protein